MTIDAIRSDLQSIQIFRNLFLTEANTQIRYNAVHERGWCDHYLLSVDGINVGYGCVMNGDASVRDTVFEFYIIPPYRNLASAIFQKLIDASNARFIECQTNITLLHTMLLEFTQNISSDVVLLSDDKTTSLDSTGLTFRHKSEGDLIFKHNHEPEGSHVIESAGEIIATGGFLLHYNVPFCDLYMEVREDMRKRGVGSYLIQELKRAAYLAGRIPAARTSVNNHASKATLIRGGMKVSGFMSKGEIRSSSHPEQRIRTTLDQDKNA